MLTGIVICPTTSNGEPLAPMGIGKPALEMLFLYSLVRVLKRIMDTAAPSLIGMLLVNNQVIL